MNREAQSVVLLLVGGAVLRISVSDVYLRYVKEGLRPFLIVSGVLLVVIAAATLWREFRGRGADHAHPHRLDHEETLAVGRESAAPHGLYPDDQPAPGEPALVDDDGHGHSHGGPKVAWLLILPVFAVFLIGPPALGSYAAGRTGTAQVLEESDFAPLPNEDPIRMTVLDYATRAIWDEEKSLAERNVRMTGFLTPRPGGGFYLTRIMLSCCAADGRPIKIGLSGELPPGVAADSWVEVIGQYDPRTDRDGANDGVIPYLRATAVKPVPVPSQPYE